MLNIKFEPTCLVWDWNGDLACVLQINEQNIQRGLRHFIFFKFQKGSKSKKMDAFSFIGNIIEFECGENNIYIGSVLDIDAQKQEISINNGKIILLLRTFS